MVITGDHDFAWLLRDRNKPGIVLGVGLKYAIPSVYAEPESQYAGILLRVWRSPVFGDPLVAFDDTHR